MSGSSPTSHGLRILGVAGSLRRDSFNQGLIEASVGLAPEGMHVEPFDLKGIPFYNADVEAKGYPEAVQRWHDAIASADGLLIATPEYQHSISGVLKNAIDWASRPPGEQPLLDKPVAIMGASSGKWGTARAQINLREVLAYNRCPVVLDTEVLVSNAAERFDDDGRLVDEDTQKFIRQLLDGLADLIHNGQG